MPRKGARSRGGKRRAGTTTVPQALARATQLHQSGRLEEARRLYRQVLAVSPDHPQAQHLLGVLHQQTGDAEGAIPLLQSAVDARPDDASFHYNLAEALRAAGQYPAAAASYRATIARAPAAADAHFGLGNALFEMGQLAEAEAAYRRAIQLSPNDAEAHNNLGNVLLASKKPEEAAKSYRAALSAEPGYADAHGNLGRVLLELKRPKEAVASLRRALEADPADAELNLMLGRAYGRAFLWSDAEQHLRSALAVKPGDTQALDALANVLLETNRADAAKACYREILDAAPDNAGALAGVGSCELQLGEFPAATRSFRSALDMNGALLPALLGLVGARQDLSESELATLKAVAQDESAAEDDKRSACFAVAEVLDRRGAYDEAFGYFRMANQIAKRDSRFDRRQWAGFVNTLTRRFSRDFFAARRKLASDSDVPVFIVGMPRSGTTLVEQIVASHPDAAGAGELYEIQHMAQGLADNNATGRPYPDCLETLGPGQTAAMAETYMNRLRAVSATARRVTDKMPGNFIHIGMIALLFPRAHVVHCQRDPMDTCVSCYCQNFRALEFTSDLVDLGEYYRGYIRLMEHWREVAPLSILDVRYEEIVADPAAQARRIIDFLGLEWDERCLRFHETKRQIRTASVWQVRQPVYTSAIGRWRRYERHLTALKDLVTEAAP